ncbi:hypothetical protein HMI54_015712 [Coelomomyces lativittatus]|nr:hypothetical protein HMI55_007276 [Coelomomyces lativittatus]KAJ1512438.1 hypothetical protein HMI54_015712 [Coelomomyces lativittatus]KAJ1515283.1 hypothetical protein HMI56_006066 [Coelomomyces lativittatus]
MNQGLLPNDVLLIILHQRLDLNDFLSLALTSHQFNTLVTPLIYKQIQPKSNESLKKLTFTYRTHPKLVKYMTSFSLGQINYRWSQKCAETITQLLTQIVISVHSLKLDNLPLVSLELNHFAYLNDTTLLNLIQVAHGQLETLDLESCRKITGSTLLEVLSLTHHLVTLNIAGLPHVNDTVLMALTKLPLLCSVDISSVDHISTHVFRRFLESSSKHLKEVKCKDCKSLFLHPELIKDIQTQLGIELDTELHSDENGSDEVRLLNLDIGEVPMMAELGLDMEGEDIWMDAFEEGDDLFEHDDVDNDFDNNVDDDFDNNVDDDVDNNDDVDDDDEDMGYFDDLPPAPGNESAIFLHDNFYNEPDLSDFEVSMYSNRHLEEPQEWLEADEEAWEDVP